MLQGFGLPGSGSGPRIRQLVVEVAAGPEVAAVCHWAAARGLAVQRVHAGDGGNVLVYARAT